MDMSGISTVVAVVIIVGVTIAITVAVALWISGIISTSSYGTSISKITILDLEAYGRLAKITAWNSGGSSISISGVYIDNRPVRVRVAYDPKDKSHFILYLNKTISDEPYYLRPGETVDLWVVTNKPLEPGVLYNVKITTSNGLSFMMPLKPSRIIPREFYEIGLASFSTPAPAADKPIRLWMNWTGSIKVFINGKQAYMSTSTIGPQELYTNVYRDLRYLKPGTNVIAIDYNSSKTTFLSMSLFVEKYLMDYRQSWHDVLRESGLWKTYNSTTPPPPDSQGNLWYSTRYDDSSWKTIQTPVGSKPYTATTYVIVPQGYTEYYRAVISIPSTVNGIRVTGVINATIRVSSDDNATLYINGIQAFHETYAHGASDVPSQWTHIFTADPTKYNLVPGEKIVLAIAVTNQGGYFYFDAEIQVRLRLANGDLVSIIWPKRVTIKYMVLGPGQAPPPGWYLSDYDDAGWKTGYLPLGLSYDSISDLPGYHIDSCTPVAATRILVRIHLDLNSENMPVGVDNDGYYDANYTCFNGYFIVFDTVDWKYRYYQLYNPCGDAKATDNFIVIGDNGQEGTIKDALSNNIRPIYEGSPPLIMGVSKAYASTYNNVPTSPIVVYVDMYGPVKDVNFTWYGLDTSYIDRFVMIKEPDEIPGLDMTLLWEDQWSSPQWTNTPGDKHAWVDEVIRVRWLENGTVRIGVYRASGDNLHMVIMYGRPAYIKPHYDEYGTNTSQPWTATADLNGDGIVSPTELVHWEIGYNPVTGTVTRYKAPSGAIITIWTLSP